LNSRRMTRAAALEVAAAHLMMTAEVAAGAVPPVVVAARAAVPVEEGVLAAEAVALQC